jgi:hypothetical protein
VGDGSIARKWLGGDNLDLNFKPIGLNRRTEGLVRIAQCIACHSADKPVHAPCSRHALPISPNVLNRQFKPARRNQAWGG